MLVTEQMLQAGVKKAVDLRILSRTRSLSHQAPDRDLMREILDAAFSVASDSKNESLLHHPSGKVEDPALGNRD